MKLLFCSAACGWRVILRRPPHPYKTELSDQTTEILVNTKTKSQSLSLDGLYPPKFFDDFCVGTVAVWISDITTSPSEKLWGGSYLTSLRWIMTSGFSEVIVWLTGGFCCGFGCTLECLCLLKRNITAAPAASGDLVRKKIISREVFGVMMLCFGSSTGTRQLATREAPGARGVRGGVPLLWCWHGPRAGRQAGALWPRLSRNQQGERHSLILKVPYYLHF